MGNYVIAGVGNYVIVNPSNLGNYVIADTLQTGANRPSASVLTLTEGRVPRTVIGTTERTTCGIMRVILVKGFMMRGSRRAG